MYKDGEQPGTSAASHIKICGARTREGTPCSNLPVTGKKRCRIHGGAKGSGAPLGNKNALKHGLYTAEAIAERKSARKVLEESLALLEQLG